jgi:short subunit dehydrogenase-like uncharacterized protein
VVHNATMNDTKRLYDIILFGASGFTGQLIANYFASLQNPDLRLAFAGRNAAKLQPVLESYEKAYPDGQTPQLIVADVGNPDSLLEMTEQARVLITTVGPYEEYGRPVVDACIKSSTHYVDITGEPSFVSDLLNTVHDEAAQKGVRIVNCCGFDSIPHDLGAYYVSKQFDGSTPIHLKGFVQAKGGISGGTWHTAVGAMASGLTRIDSKRQLAAPQGSDRRIQRGKERLFYEKRLRSWAVPFPTIDGSIVRRSAKALSSYGPDFSYSHFLRIRSFGTVALFGLGAGAVMLGSKWKKTREALLRFRQPGDGPDEETRRRGWFKVTFLAESESGQLMAEVEGGEPGYHETSRWAAECGLLLAFQEDQLPEAAGVLTPAVAFGDVLLNRLQEIGISFRHQTMPL